MTFNDKRSIIIACEKYYSFDMRSFHNIDNSSFKALCQSLFDLEYQYGTVKMDVALAILTPFDPVLDQTS